MNDFPSAMAAISDLSQSDFDVLEVVVRKTFFSTIYEKGGAFYVRALSSTCQVRLTRSVVTRLLLRIVRMILNLRFFCPQTVSFLSALYQSWQHISVIWEKDIP